MNSDQSRNLQDQGWDRMKEILDREMPARRVLPFWFVYGGAAAAVALIILGGISIMKRTMNQDFDIPTVSESLVMTKESAANSDNDHLEVTTAQDTLSEVVAALDLSSQHRNNNELPILPVKDAADEEATVHDVGADEVEKLNSVMMVETSTLKPEVQASGLTRSEAGKESAAIYDPFPTLGYRLYVPLSIDYELTTYFSGTEEATIVKVTKQRKWMVDAVAGLTTTSNLKKPGFDFGADLTYKLSRQISIGAGVHLWTIGDYEIFSQLQENDLSSDFKANFGAVAPEMLDIMDANSLSAGQNNQVLYSGSTKTLTYLRMPIQVSMFPEGKWSPHLGISTLVLLSNRDYSGRAEDASPDNVTGLYAIRSIPSLLQKTNVAAELGVMFRAGARFGVDLTYSHGFKSYLNYDIEGGEVPELHKGFRASIRYTIMGAKK